jgi:hypothetical protein
MQFISENPEYLEYDDEKKHYIYEPRAEVNITDDIIHRAFLALYPSFKEENIQNQDKEDSMKDKKNKKDKKDNTKINNLIRAKAGMPIENKDKDKDDNKDSNSKKDKNTMNDLIRRYIEGGTIDDNS